MASYVHIERGFDPVFDGRSRVLVLGSFPSVASRADGFYYGHPRNRFWPVLAAVTGEPVPAAGDVGAKRAMLLAHGMALWDVAASCDVAGSSDASIRNVVPVDVRRVLDAAPIGCVVCNGATAGRLYGRWLEGETGMPALVLPSTSPANATWDLERLLGRWDEALGPWVRAHA